MHCLGKICALLFDFSRGIYHFLVKHLIAISEVLESCAEYHSILVHVHSNRAMLCHELFQGFTILSFLEESDGFLELFEILDLEEVDETDRGLELLTAGESLQEPLELLLSLCQCLLGHLV